MKKKLTQVDNGLPKLNNENFTQNRDIVANLLSQLNTDVALKSEKERNLVTQNHQISLDKRKSVRTSMIQSQKRNQPISQTQVRGNSQNYSSNMSKKVQAAYQTEKGNQRSSLDKRSSLYKKPVVKETFNERQKREMFERMTEAHNELQNFFHYIDAKDKEVSEKDKSELDILLNNPQKDSSSTSSSTKNEYLDGLLDSNQMAIEIAKKKLIEEEKRKFHQQLVPEDEEVDAFAPLPLNKAASSGVNSGIPI